MSSKLKTSAITKAVPTQNSKSLQSDLCWNFLCQTQFTSFKFCEGSGKKNHFKETSLKMECRKKLLIYDHFLELFLGASGII